MNCDEAARIRAEEWFDTDTRGVWGVEYRTVSFPKKHERFWWEFGRDIFGLMDEECGAGHDEDVGEEVAKRFCDIQALRFIGPMGRFLQDIIYFFSHTLPDTNIDDSEWRKQWRQGVRRKVTYGDAIWLVPMMEWYQEWCMSHGRNELVVIARHYVGELEREEERAFLQEVYNLIQENPMLWS